MKEISIYIHIPFCVRKCLYCDFNSFSGKDSRFEDYKNALISEINNFENPYSEDLLIKTIFVGGGTPSVLPPEYMEEIFSALKIKFTLADNAEISIELNPGTVDRHKLSTYKEIGINRLSIGVQSLNDRLLKTLGRIHNTQQFIETVELAKSVGFSNINFDLMFALPNQSIDDFKETLETAVSLEPTHISVYSLIIEEGTPFFDLFESGKLKEIPEEVDRKMYYMAKDILKKAGFIQYEISNFAKNGYECKHNIVYWERKEYIGFGLGACSFLNGKRFHNNYNLDEYIKGEYFGSEEEFTPKDAFAEFIFLGLRMNKGVSAKEFYDYFGEDLYCLFGDVINKNIGLGLLEEKGDRIRLTEKGVDLSNSVFIDFL